MIFDQIICDHRGIAWPTAAPGQAEAARDIARIGLMDGPESLHRTPVNSLDIVEFVSQGRVTIGHYSYFL
jgi:hypothetical protein